MEGKILADKRVILFDIDGTLVSSQKSELEESRRYADAIEAVTGKRVSVNPSRFAGMVDPQICKIILEEAGFDEHSIANYVPKIITRMAQAYITMEKRVSLNRGVRELLDTLVNSPTHVLGVLTGNISAIGREKLSSVELDRYFSEYFYADDYDDRSRLVDDAVKSCLTKYKLSLRTNLIIIGDTPLDVKAANAAQATSIGVASGVYSMEQLSGVGAAHVFRDLVATKSLLNALDFST
jgi:phosphoglycolate phosphatase